MLLVVQNNVSGYVEKKRSWMRKRKKRSASAFLSTSRLTNLLCFSNPKIILLSYSKTVVFGWDRLLGVATSSDGSPGPWTDLLNHACRNLKKSYRWPSPRSQNSGMEGEDCALVRARSRSLAYHCLPRQRLLLHSMKNLCAVHSEDSSVHSNSHA